MKCKYHPVVDAFTECARCQIPLCGICAEYTPNGIMCAQCATSAAAEAAVTTRVSKADQLEQMLADGRRLQDDQFAQARAARRDKDKRFAVIQAVIAGVAFIAMGARLWFAMGPPSILSPAEVQALDLAESRKSACVQVFWEIASVLQDGREPDPSLACPEAGASNIVTRQGGDIIVSHPNPALLGYSSISVSRSNPVPVLLN